MADAENLMTSTEHLDDLIGRLERAAEQLRSGELSQDAAAGMVEDCAALATQATAEINIPKPISLRASSALLSEVVNCTV